MSSFVTQNSRYHTTEFIKNAPYCEIVFLFGALLGATKVKLGV